MLTVNDDAVEAAARWLPIPGWPRYEVSDAGLVRRNGRLVGQWSNQDGYRLVRLSGPRAMKRVHRLVAAAFVGNPEQKPCVNHIDCDRANNAASNLEWCTQPENLRHARALGRMPDDYWRGKRSPNAGLSDETVQAIHALRKTETLSHENIGRRLGVSKRTVGRVLRRETYTYVQPAAPSTAIRARGER